jgi:hypothetical protein
MCQEAAASGQNKIKNRQPTTMRVFAFLAVTIHRSGADEAFL